MMGDSGLEPSSPKNTRTKSTRRKCYSMSIPTIKRFIPRFEHEGFFAIYFDDQTYLEVPFYELLSWACQSDEALLAYLQNLPPYYTVYEEIEDLEELGYDFRSILPRYLHHCERVYPGFLYEFRLHVEDLPEGYTD